MEDEAITDLLLHLSQELKGTDDDPDRPGLWEQIAKEALREAYHRGKQAMAREVGLSK